MPGTLQQFLASFDALPDADKRQAIVEILRRFADEDEGDVPESALLVAADELFRALDEEEAGCDSLPEDIAPKDVPAWHLAQ